MAQDLRVLPDGGVLVSSGQVIARLDKTGVLTQTYEVPGEGALWAGLDLAGDGTFWAATISSSNVYGSISPTAPARQLQHRDAGEHRRRHQSEAMRLAMTADSLD